MFGEVIRTERLTPSMVRVVLGGSGLDGFEPTPFTDQYVNASFVPAGAPLAVPFDNDLARSLPDEHRPRPRRFTVRRWDTERRELTIDFAAHGDVGYAGAWAQRAVPGDRLQFRGPSGGYEPRPDADWHLLIGDESALPAIAASIEALPADARCTAVIVVDDATGEVSIDSACDAEIIWCHRATSSEPEHALLDAISSLEWPGGDVDVFLHGEAGEVREVRKFLVAERGLDPKAASISAYWRRDHTDEAWRAIKREWNAAQAQDA